MHGILGFSYLLNDLDLGASSKAFEYLGGAELSVAAVRVGPVFVEPRPFLFVTGRVTSTSVADILQLRFNDDEGANYWHRNQVAPAGSSLFTNTGTPSTTGINLAQASGTTARTFMAVIHNNGATTRSVAHFQAQATGAAATAGGIWFGAGEWATTNLIQMIELRTAGGTATMAADSGFAVFGAALG